MKPLLILALSALCSGSGATVLLQLTERDKVGVKQWTYVVQKAQYVNNVMKVEVVKDVIFANSFEK